MNGPGSARGGTALVVAVVVAVVAVVAAAWLVIGRSSDDTAEPTAATTTRPDAASPTPSPQPSPERADPPSAYALTLAGDLVEVEPQSGDVIRTIATSPYWEQSDALAVSPDGAYAYIEAFSESDPAGPAWPGEIQRVPLAEGATEIATVVTSATSPAVSPDGTTLAYLSIAPGNPEALVRSLTLMDIGSGTVTAAVPDDECVECERVVTQPTWTPDSARLVVGLGWTDGFPNTTLWEVDPASTATLGAGRAVGPDNSGDVQAAWSGTTAFSSDGTLLVPADEGTTAQWAAARAYAFGEGPKENLPTSHVAFVDAANGSVLRRVSVDGTALAVAPAPSGDDVLVVVGHPGTDEVPNLYRWDGSTLTHLRDGFTSVDW